MKILDIVKTKNNKIAIIKEISESQNGHPQSASLLYLFKKDRENEHISWFKKEELKILGSLKKELLKYKKL